MPPLDEAPRTTPPHGCIAAVATLSMKPRNQDACRVLRDEDGATVGIAIADGIGSYYGGEVASAAVVDAFEAVARKPGFVTPTCSFPLDLFFAQAQQNLARTVGELAGAGQLPEDLDPARSFGTTAITVTMSPRGIYMAYLGNGAVLNLRGDFNQLPPGRLLPVSASLLNPHVFFENGRSVLNRFLGPTTPPDDCLPDGLFLLENARFGEIVIALTDGILSQEEALVGRDHRGNIFQEAKPAVVLLHETLGNLFRDVVTERLLDECLKRYLETLLERNLVDDDVTVGVLVSAKALAWLKSKLPSPVMEEVLA